MEPSDAVRTLARRRLRLVVDLEATRAQLADAIRADLHAGVRQSALARATEYTREQIRRIGQGRTT